MKTKMSRRSALAKLAGGAAVAAASAALAERLGAADAATAGLKGNVNHSVCRWCYQAIPLDDLCQAGREMGLQSIELINPEDFPTIKKHGLICAMVFNPTIDGLGGIPKAWNRLENHDKLVPAYEQRIKDTADAGFTRLICFSGNRGGLDDQKGMENCATGLKRVLPTAEKYKVTLCMELLNSKVNHKDYMCDHSAWGIGLVKSIASDNFKLLYDIYHMQIMEGDVIHTIQDNHQYFAHYHTGGVPGRGEIDDTQELNYPAIMKAILATGFKGHVAQEFVPKRPDKIASLRQGVQICDV